MDGPDTTDLLRQYLAERDVSCPSCGYNLRGIAGEKCPECAYSLMLGIARTGPAGALTWFLLLAFGWVFAAGAMNLARNVQSVLTYVNSARIWAFTAVQGRIIINNQGQPVGSAAAAAIRPAVGSGYWWTTAGQAVPAMSWASVAWAAALVLGCGAGLLLMLLRRWRPFTPAGDTRLVRFACAMFAVYAGWHVAMFILEFT